MRGDYHLLSDLELSTFAEEIATMPRNVIRADLSHVTLKRAVTIRCGGATGAYMVVWHGVGDYMLCLTASNFQSDHQNSIDYFGQAEQLSQTDPGDYNLR
jgi:hypothetical protein